MANEYATLATLKRLLNLETADTTSDDLLTQALEAASRGIDRMCGRRFWLDPAPVARTFNPSGRTVATESGDRLVVNDLGSVTGLTVETGSGGSYSAVTTYETGPDNALADARPVTSLLSLGGSWGYGAARVRITGRWGWPAVPAEVVQATQIQALRLYRRKDSPDGVTGSAEWGVVRLSRVDPDVYTLVQHLTLPGFG